MNNNNNNSSSSSSNNNINGLVTAWSTVPGHVTLAADAAASSHLHGDVRMVQSPPAAPAMSDTLRISYLLTLPFFNTVACLTNILLLLIFSTGTIRKYRASVFFRYLAVVDAAQSCVTFGLMWLALVVPQTYTASPADMAVHCKTYTILRYTMQDLSALGVVCLVMERCSAMSTRASSPHSRPTCVVLTVCRFQWVLRHLSCKMFLFFVSVLTLLVNVAMVLSAGQELDQPSLIQCFNTWKSPQDLMSDIRSLPMTHAMLSMAIPTLCCVVGYLCLRALLHRQPPSSSHPSAPGPTTVTTTTTTDQHQQQQQPGVNHQAPHSRRPSRASVTHTRWIHLGFHTPNPTTAPTPPGYDSGSLGFPPPPHPPHPPPAPTLTMMSVDDGDEEEGGARGSCFLDRLYAMIKSREFMLSVVCVEDSRLTSVPPPDLAQDFNAMATTAAIFFVLLVQPQLLLITAGCIIRSSSSCSSFSSSSSSSSSASASSYESASPSPAACPLNWTLVKNIGLTADLIFNNRVSFTLFLFLFTSGRRLSVILSDFLHRIVSCCFCYHCRCLLLRMGPRRSRGGGALRGGAGGGGGGGAPGNPLRVSGRFGSGVRFAYPSRFPNAATTATSTTTGSSRPQVSAMVLRPPQHPLFCSPPPPSSAAGGAGGCGGSGGGGGECGVDEARGLGQGQGGGQGRGQGQGGERAKVVVVVPELSIMTPS